MACLARSMTQSLNSNKHPKGSGALLLVAIKILFYFPWQMISSICKFPSGAGAKRLFKKFPLLQFNGGSHHLLFGKMQFETFWIDTREIVIHLMYHWFTMSLFNINGFWIGSIKTLHYIVLHNRFSLTCSIHCKELQSTVSRSCPCNQVRHHV